MGWAVRRVLLVVVAAALLASCDNLGGGSTCPPGGGNLIRDADFALEAENKSARFWGQSQHAGEVSFTTSIEGGVLTIQKTGTQPWFVFRQILRSADFGGQKLLFSADVKLDMRPPEKTHGLGDGGWLRVAARSAKGALLLRSELEQEPHIGTTDWEPVRVLVDLPRSTRRVDLSLLHQADGVMSVRNPYFGPQLKCGEP